MTAPTNPTEAMVDNAENANKPAEEEAPKVDDKPEDTTSEIEKIKAELAQKEAALAKANQERTAAQRKYKELRDKENPEQQENLNEALSPWKAALVKTQLTAKGLTPEAAAIISRLIDLSKIEMSEDSIEGLDQIDELEKTMPQLFAKPTKDEDKPSGPTPAANRPIETGNPSTPTPTSVLSDASKQMLKGLRG